MKTALVTSLALFMGGVLTIYIFNIFINKKISSLISDDEGSDMAVSVVKGLVFLSCSLVLLEIHSTFQILIKLWGENFIDSELFMKEVLFFAVFLGITIIALFTAFGFAFFTFGVIARKQSLYIEIANNNIATSLFFGLLFLSFALIAKTSIPTILESLIPFPSSPLYR